MNRNFLLMAVLAVYLAFASCKAEQKDPDDVYAWKRYREDREWVFGNIERYTTHKDSVGFYADSIMDAMRMLNLNEHYLFEFVLKDRIGALLRLDSIVEASGAYLYASDSMILHCEKSISEYSGAELSVLALVYRDFMFNRFLWEKYEEIEKMKPDTMNYFD